MSRKIHWDDQRGPICGASSGVAYLGYNWSKITAQSLREVTCKRCVKKLLEIGFNVARFEEVAREGIRI